MNFIKYTRRKFLESACVLTAMPVSQSSFLPFSAAPLPQIERNQDGIALTDLDRIQRVLKQELPAIWLFSGDSITAGVEHTHGYRSYPEIFAERIKYELGRSFDQVINTGISGYTTSNIIQHFEWNIKHFKPTVVSLMVGTNDAAEDREISLKEFERNLDKLVNRIRMLEVIPILHTPNLIIKEKAPERSRLQDYVEVIKQVAIEKEMILVDNWTHWQQAADASSLTKVYKEWLNDPLHPNGRGHSEIARLMFKELLIFNADAATCGGKYYEGEH